MSNPKNSILPLIRPHLKQIIPYEAVDPPEALAIKAGIAEKDIVKLNANENPFGPSFDSSIIYAPVFGQMYYAGIRFKIK